MTGGEDKTVAIEPARSIGIVRQNVTVKNSANLSAAKRKSEVAGGTLMDGVHGEATGLVSGESENFSLEFHAKN